MIKFEFLIGWTWCFSLALGVYRAFLQDVFLYNERTSLSWMVKLNFFVCDTI